jgi:hypothetical protein
MHVGTGNHQRFIDINKLYRVTDKKPLTLYLTYSLADLNK